MAACQVYYDEALELVRLGGDQRAIANALYNASFPANVDKSDLPKAQRLLGEALPMFRRLDDEAGIARCLWALAQTYVYSNDDEKGIESLDEAIVLFRRLGDMFGLGWALFVRAVVALKQQDIAVAESLAAEALRIFADAHDVSGAVLVLDALAEAAARSGDAIRAQRLAGAASAHEVATGAYLTTVVVLREGWRRVESTPSPAEKVAREEGAAMPLDQAIAYALSSDAELSKP